MRPDRRRASPRERVRLWLAAGGRCRACGAEIDERFHADHGDPFVRVGRTNVHELRALCPRCNLSKGATMLRAHQREMLEIADDPEVGPVVRRVIADVTPGGGKSALPVILARRLMARGAIDAVCWLVPRDNLRRQAEEAFQAAWLRRHLGHDMEIRAARNDINPRRGLAGYATTYQAVLQEPDLHADEMRRSRYLLVLDEPHHVAEGSPFHRALRDVVSAAAVVLMMSGTFSRSDGQRIAFLDYEPTAGGKLAPILRAKRRDTRSVGYGRREALAERAILPVFFERLDGKAAWIGRDGAHREVGSLRGLGDDTPAAVFTALKESYADALLERSVERWRERQEATPGSKLLVVSPNILQAKRYLDRLRALQVAASDIATSDDGEAAVRNIRRLRGEVAPALDALVTVAMAYEGMDCPTVSHIACLTHIRSAEWIEQMIARAVRVDGRFPHEVQDAWVFAPDDDLFSACVARIRDQQREWLSARDRDLLEGGGGQDPARGTGEIVPIAAAATAARGEGLDDGEVGPAEYERLSTIARKHGFGFVNPVKLRAFLAEVDVTRPVDPPAGSQALPLTPREREDKIKQRLDETIGAVARKQIEQGRVGYLADADRGRAIGLRKKELNGELVRAFGVGRAEATEAVLREMWRFLVTKYLPDGEVSDAGSA